MVNNSMTTFMHFVLKLLDVTQHWYGVAILLVSSVYLQRCYVSGEGFEDSVNMLKQCSTPHHTAAEKYTHTQVKCNNSYSP